MGVEAMAGGEGSGGFRFKRPGRDEGKKMMEGLERATRPDCLTQFLFRVFLFICCGCGGTTALLASNLLASAMEILPSTAARNTTTYEWREYFAKYTPVQILVYLSR